MSVTSSRSRVTEVNCREVGLRTRGTEWRPISYGPVFTLRWVSLPPLDVSFLPASAKWTHPTALRGKKTNLMLQLNHWQN